MKSQEEIEKMTSELKDALVDATGEQFLLLQGFLRGLRYVLSDEDEEKEA